MLSDWEAFIQFLTSEENGCELIDDSDWAYPVYRRKGNGRICGLDTSVEIDDFIICYTCNEFMIEPPEEHDNGIYAFVKELKKDGLPGVPPSSDN